MVTTCLAQHLPSVSEITSKEYECDAGDKRCEIGFRLNWLGIFIL